MEFLGSSPSRSYTGRMADPGVDTPLSGFLNRKCVFEAGGKKSKDRSWQTYWCQLKGVSLEFHRVDGVKSEGFNPPPRDIFPPPHMAQHKAGFVSVADAITSDDCSYQTVKDIQKRRSWLFDLTLSNGVVYHLQAPNATQRAHWIQHIRQAASDQKMDNEGRKLKASRCSVRHRSRQNVFSVKGGAAVAGDVAEAYSSTGVRDNYYSNILREMLVAKKELLAGMSRMCNAFLGHTQHVYSEDVKKGPFSIDDSVASQHLNLLQSFLPPLAQDCHPPASSEDITPTYVGNSPRVVSHMLKSHLLVPGASWSRLNEGEEIILTGRLSNGWFRCIATVDVTANIGENVEVESSSGGDGKDSEMSPASYDIKNKCEDKTTPVFKPQDQYMEQGTDVTRSSYDDRPTHTREQESHHSMRIARSYSYVMATEPSNQRVQNPRRSLDCTYSHQRIAENDSPSHADEKSNVVPLLESLLSKVNCFHSHSYRFPLVGVVPLSVIENVPDISDLPMLLNFQTSSPITTGLQVSDSYSTSATNHGAQTRPTSSPVSSALLEDQQVYKQPSEPIDSPSTNPTQSLGEEISTFQSPSSSPIPYFPPSSPLPPAMLDFAEHELKGSIRARVSSVSGRPIRSTGICLRFGEDGSSSDSEIESAVEQDKSLSQSRLCNAAFSHYPDTSLSSSTGFISGLRFSPDLSADVLAPGNLRRTASACECPLEEQSGRKKLTIPRTGEGSNSTHSLNTAPMKQRSYEKRRGEDEFMLSKGKGVYDAKSHSECSNVGDIFQHPPAGQRRYVCLDARHRKLGIRLESYSHPSDPEQKMKVFVQSVIPGSPAFMSGLFPGDLILQVDGVDVHNEPVSSVVKKITGGSHKEDNRILLTVMFVDGVARLERMKKLDNLKYQVKMKQAQLKVMILEESSYSAPASLPLQHNITLASDVESWSQQTMQISHTSHLYPYDRVLNDHVTLCCGQPSELACDVLVVPLFKDDISFLASKGGSELLDELSLASMCPMGECIVTRGYLLPTRYVHHCVFGDLMEDLQNSIWHALENGCIEKMATIAFWLDGFSKMNVSPGAVLGFVRLWLQQSGKCRKYAKILFSSASPSLTKEHVEKCFPLFHYRFKSSKPDSVSGVSSDLESNISTTGDTEGLELPTESRQPTSMFLQSDSLQAGKQETRESLHIQTPDEACSSSSLKTLNALRLESDV